MSRHGSKEQLLFQSTRYFSPPPSSSFELPCPLQLAKQTTLSPTFVTYTNSATLHHPILLQVLGIRAKCTLTHQPPSLPTHHSCKLYLCSLPPDAFLAHFEILLLPAQAHSSSMEATTPGNTVLAAFHCDIVVVLILQNIQP